MRNSRKTTCPTQMISRVQNPPGVADLVAFIKTSITGIYKAQCMVQTMPGITATNNSLGKIAC